MNFCFISNLSMKKTTTKTNPIQSNKFNTEFDQIGILPSQQWRELHLQVIQEVDLYLLVRQPTWLGLPLRWNHFSMTSWQFTWFLVKYYPLSDLCGEKEITISFPHWKARCCGREVLTVWASELNWAAKAVTDRQSVSPLSGPFWCAVCNHRTGLVISGIIK